MTSPTETITLILLIIVLVWAGVLTAMCIRFWKAYQKLTAGISKKDLKTILTKVSDAIARAETNIQTLADSLQDTEVRSKNHIQKIGFIRFNPFSDTGGDQSFVLCLLDDHNNGIVITSLHSRDQTRIYTKQIIQGKPKDHELSKEEYEAVKQAITPKKRK